MNPVELLRAQTRRDADCWIWTGTVGHYGYGQVWWRGKRYPTHRLMYRLVKGPIPAKHDVCHACDQPACINPDHLWAGTRRENMVDCVEKGRHYSTRKTHCTKGHEFTPENTYVTKTGKRHCITCQRIRQRIRAGWPESLAVSADRVPKGERPVSAQWRAPTPGRKVRTHCKRGHELAGANLYVTPEGHRKCLACHYENRRARMKRAADDSTADRESAG